MTRNDCNTTLFVHQEKIKSGENLCRKKIKDNFGEPFCGNKKIMISL